MAGQKQIALQPLVAEARREIAAIAEAEGRLSRARDDGLDHAWRLGKTLIALKEQVGRGNWYIWLGANLSAIGNTETMRRANASRCMALFRDNPDRRNSCDSFSPETVRKFMWGYVPKKERLQLEGNLPNKPGAHHLTFCNEFRRWDSQVRSGRADLHLEHFEREIEPVLRRIREILGPESFAKLTS
jgi:hypothetical protein